MMGVKNVLGISCGLGLFGAQQYATSRCARNRVVNAGYVALIWSA